MARHPYSDRFKRAALEQTNEEAAPSSVEQQSDREAINQSILEMEPIMAPTDDDDYVQPLTQVREPLPVEYSKPPVEPPPISSLVNFVYDPKTVLSAKVTATPWGQYRQLALEVTVQVEVREQLGQSPLGGDTPAIGNRRHYRGVRPDEQEELMAQQTGTMLEPTVEELEVETGVRYESRVVQYPKVRWEARAKPGQPGTAGTWHQREQGDE